MPPSIVIFILLPFISATSGYSQSMYCWSTWAKTLLSVCPPWDIYCYHCTQSSSPQGQIEHWHEECNGSIQCHSKVCVFHRIQKMKWYTGSLAVLDLHIRVLKLLDLFWAVSAGHATPFIKIMLVVHPPFPPLLPSISCTWSCPIIWEPQFFLTGIPIHALYSLLCKPKLHTECFPCIESIIKIVKH